MNKTVPGLGIRRRLFDTFDSLYLGISGKNLPPRSLRAYVGRIEDFERVPQEFIAYFKLLCGLEMNHTILDVGCGPGRFASQLICAPHFFHGRYYGFDTHKRSVDWANARLARYHPNFTFQCVDLRNSHYNPRGTLDPETFAFPYDDNTFDFVFAVSVFTHLLPGAARNYLRQISRVLKPQSNALVTFLILEHPQETLSESARQTLKDLLHSLGSVGKWHHCDGYSTISPEKPEAMIAYQEKVVTEMLERCNLQKVNVYAGAWNRQEEYLSFQDIIIVRKP